MKALLSLKSAISQSYTFGIIALALLTPVIYPHYALAAEQQILGQQAQVFEIKISDSSILNQTPKQNYQKFLTIDEVEDNDTLVVALTEYLEKHNSPLSVYSAEMIKQPQWQRALAISWVESNFGRRCANNNCSGIGVAPGHPAWRKYQTKLDWFKDMSALMERPIYKEKYTTFKQMRGIYVYPGTDNWVFGATKKYNELMALTKQAEVDRQLKAQSLASLFTFAVNLE